MTLKSEIHQEAIDFQKTEIFQTRKKDRYKIEAKNAELKQSHGLKRCKFKGLFGMKIQSYMTAFVVNAKRIVVLVVEEKASKLEKKQMLLKIEQVFTIYWKKTKRVYQND